MNNYHFFFPGTIFSDTPEDKVAECKTEKSKHLQRKNFGTAGEYNFSTCIVALNEWKNDIEMILWASLLVEEESVYNFHLKEWC